MSESIGCEQPRRCSPQDGMLRTSLTTSLAAWMPASARRFLSLLAWNYRATDAHLSAARAAVGDLVPERSARDPTASAWYAFTIDGFALRALADWAAVGLPAVAVVDEFEGDDQGDGEGELGEAVLGFSVGVSSQLPVVGQP